MLAVQFEGGAVVVEPACLPIVKTVAFLAIGGAVFLKLPAVHVFVAADTGGGGDYKSYFGVDSFLDMARRTVLPGVCAFQGVTG